MDSRGSYLITGVDCLRRCVDIESEVVAQAKNVGLSMIVTAGEESGVWAGLGSHKFVYYSAVVKMTLEINLYMERVETSPL